MAHPVTLIPGDGIGREVTDAARAVLDASGAEIEWHVREAGMTTFESGGESLPSSVVESIRADGVALKGPIATPIGRGFRSVNVALRKQLVLFANYRPARSILGVPSRYRDVDLIVVRENTEGLYSGIEHVVVPGVVESLRVITEHGSERIIRFAFETARTYHRRRVTAVHKANILKQSDGLWLEVARRVAQEFPDIGYDEAIVDATAMRLVLDPTQFDVLVMENLFGDILSDLTSGLIGGLGVAPSANIGSDCAIFEPVHGSAPDIAGKGIANPTATLLSAVLLLRRLGEEEAADRVESAVLGAVADPASSTVDLGGSAGTEQFVAAVISRIGDGATR